MSMQEKINQLSRDLHWTWEKRGDAWNCSRWPDRRITDRQVAHLLAADIPWDLTCDDGYGHPIPEESYVAWEVADELSRVPLVVTRHAGLIEYLERHALEPGSYDHVEHATEADVAGRTVYGVLPLALAAAAESVYVVDLSAVPAELRGAELTADQVEAYAGELVCYEVEPIK
jgi:putative CRISPR-associated protein (TIGR02620 family)